jgi:hypothetical protein
MPSAVPSHSPTEKPFLGSTFRPSRKPTLRPTAFPTSAPTAVPTLSLIGEWKEFSEEVIASLPPTDPSDIISYHELSAESSALLGGCGDWSIFTSSLSEVTYSAKKFVNISALEMTELGASTLNRWVTCTEEKNTANIANAMLDLTTDGSSKTVSCDGREWTVIRCAGKISVCVDCTATLSCPSVVVCGTDTDGNAEGMLVAPCITSCPVANVGNGGRLRLLLVALQDRNPPPDVISVSSIATKYSIVQTATLSASGSIVCAAYPTSVRVTSISINSVLLRGIKATTAVIKGNHVAMVTLPRLIPSTSYSVVCLTQSIDGVLMAAETMQRQTKVVKTSCCKAIDVGFLESFTSEGSEIFSALQLSIASAPSLDLTIDLRCKFTDTNNVSSVISPFFKTQYKFTSSSQTLVYTTGFRAQSPGKHQLDIVLSGSSKNEYAVHYGNSLLTVFEIHAEPPPPRLSSAVFSDDGSSVTVRFDSSTDYASLGNIFSCNRLFRFDDAGKCRCQWLDASGVVIYVTGTNAVDVNDEISLLPSILKAECPSSDCSDWQYAIETTVRITAPAFPTTPIVSISGPSLIGECDSLALDISGSTGSGGRAWASLVFAVQSPSPNVSEVETFLNTKYKISPPTAIPSALLRSGFSYLITTTLCNFLNACSQSSHRVTVSTNIVPVVSILGPTKVTAYRKNPLLLTADAYSSSCNGAKSYSYLKYVWSIFKNGAELRGPNFQSVSVEPRKLKLNAFSLDVDTFYTVKLTVLHTNTLKASSTTTTVYVSKSDIIASISGGSQRSVKFGESIVIDASASYDEDTGTNTLLTFQWVCVQLQPFYSEACPLSGALSTMASKITLSASETRAIGAVTRLSVRVSDSSRVAERSVDITTVSPSAPEVIITSNVVKVNPSIKLKLSGAVTLEAPGTVSWSISDPTIDLASISLVPTVTKLSDVSSSTTSLFNLVLSANSLPERSTFTFKLICEVLGGVSSFAAITVRINGPPFVGVLTSNPTQGTMLNTSFQLVASRFEDDDIPLTYEFGYYSSGTNGAIMVLQSKSLKSHVSSTLPAGPKSNGFVVVVLVRVFDSLSANTSATTMVVVERVEVRTDDLLGMFNASIQSNGDVDGAKRALATTTSTLNAVDCSKAPDCSAIGRGSCNKVANTCGYCMEGYIGNYGYDNSRCVSVINRRRLNVADSMPCASDEECGIWSACDDGVCSSIPQTCPLQCSAHGDCLFRDTRTFKPLSECFMGDSHCEGFCSCHTGFWGSQCSFTTKEGSSRMFLREKLMSSLHSVTTSEDLTYDSVASWIATLSAVAINSDEISLEAAVIIVDVCRVIIRGANSLALPYESMLVVFDTLHVIETVLRSYDSSELDMWNIAVSDVSLMVTLLSKTVMNDMVVGQSNINVIHSTMRVSVTKGDPSSTSLSLSAPQTDVEKWMGDPVQSCDVNLGDSASGDVVMITTPSGAHATGVNSNPIELVLPSSCEISECTAVFIMQNNEAVSFAVDREEPTVIHEVLCMEDVIELHALDCPHNYTGEVSCNGTAGSFLFSCPHPRAVSTCRQLLGETVGNEDTCEVVSYTPTNTTCKCVLSPTAGSRKTRRLGGGGSSEEESSVEFATMINTVYDDFTSTWESADDISVASLQDSWEVLVTTGCVGVVVVIGVLLGDAADKRDAADVVPSEENKIKKFARKKTFSLSAIVPAEASALGSRRRASQDGNRRKSSVLEMDMQLIDESLPAALSSKPFVERFVEENRKNHRWLGVIFYFSPHFSRMLRILSLATNIVVMFFMQALTYNIAEADDGTCEEYKNEQDCLEEDSAFARGENKCYWVADKEACFFTEPTDDFKRVVFVAIICAVVSAPLSLSVDWLIISVLAKSKERPHDDVKVAPATATTGQGEKGMVLKTQPTAQHKMKRIMVRQQSMLCRDVFGNSASDELRELSVKIGQYRQSLNATEMKEFDGTFIC